MIERESIVSNILQIRKCRIALTCYDVSFKIIKRADKFNPIIAVEENGMGNQFIKAVRIKYFADQLKKILVK